MFKEYLSDTDNILEYKQWVKLYLLRLPESSVEAVYDFGVTELETAKISTQRPLLRPHGGLKAVGKCLCLSASHSVTFSYLSPSTEVGLES